MKANENPFRSSNVERIRYGLARKALDKLTISAIDLRWCSLLGPHGTGKTTLLEDLEPLLEERGKTIHRVCLNRDSTRQERDAALEGLRELHTGSICLFDGAEALSRWRQHRLRCNAQKQGFGLIATLHRKSRLPVLYRTETDWKVAEKLVRRLSQDHCSQELITVAQLAFKQNGGNVREVFRACYWQLAQTTA